MIIQGKPIASMMDPQLMVMLREHGVVYLHKSAEGDGWIASMFAEPQDPMSPETITLRRRGNDAPNPLPRSEQFDTPAWSKADATVATSNWVERSRALLKRIEWKGEYFYDYDGSVNACPCCDGAEPSDTARQWVKPELIGHRPGCELAALIAGTEAAPDLRAVLQRLVDAVTESGRKGVIYLGSALGDAREALRLSGVRPG